MTYRKKPGPQTPWQRRVRYNRARCVERLKPSQIENLKAADVFAGTLNTPLNCFLTIKFSESDHSLREFHAATKRLSQWHRRWGGVLRWIYVWEAIGGLHLHALIHIPRNAWKLFEAAIRSAFAGHDVLLKRRYVGPSMMAYLFKGTDWATHHKLARQTHIKVKGQGNVFWKRCGCTENLGHTTRKKAQINCEQTYTKQSHKHEPRQAIADDNRRGPSITHSYVVSKQTPLPLEAACCAAHTTQAQASTPGNFISRTSDPCASMGDERTGQQHE